MTDIKRDTSSNILRFILIILAFVIGIYLLISILFSFGKVSFWIYNKSGVPVTVTSCYFENKKLLNCPSLISAHDEHVSEIFETDTIFSLNKTITYSLKLSLVINGKVVEKEIVFHKMRGSCDEMIDININHVIKADSLCTNPFS